MGDGFRPALLLAAAVGSGVMAGAYFAFSSFVMPALRGLPPARGIDACRRSTAPHRRPGSWRRCSGPPRRRSPWPCPPSVVSTTMPPGRRSPEAGLYLASVVPTAAWDRYLAEWLPGNHARVLTCIAATVSFVVAVARR